MRSTFTGLNTMVRGILNNQMSLDTTGHNITNAGTDGYSRQSVNSVATRAQNQGSIYGQVLIGTGVDAMAIQRARDVYADIQYRNENPLQQYYKTLAVNYDKLETIFDDSRDLGVEEAMGKFYQSWVDLSTTSSTAASRTQVVEQGRNLSNVIQTAVEELQKQINSEYEDLADEVDGVNQMLEHLVSLNNQIVAQEATGATANDLRDQRDLLTDDLSNYVNISVSEDEKGAYIINSGGITLVNGVDRTHLDMGNGVSSVVYGVDYGITDFNVRIIESNMAFLPQSGILRARYDAIDECKSFIDKMADIANFLLSTFNDQHKQGYDLDGSFKYVDENGNEIDASDVNTDKRVEFVDSNGNYVDTAEVRSVNGRYQTTAGVTVTKVDGEQYLLNDESGIVKVVPNTMNFFGSENINYTYRYDAERRINYLYKDDPNELDESKRLLTGVQIINELEINSIFGDNRGYRYVAATTSKAYKEERDSSGVITNSEWVDMAWDSRTGDGTNAVYLSELFNINLDTIIYANPPSGNTSLIREKCILRDRDGNTVDENGNIVDDPNDYVYATAITRLSINSFYQKAMSQLGLDSHAVDINYDAMEVILTQVSNWRDATAGVDWNEELTNMIKFQKGYASCSRCLTTMDEMLDRLINNTGVVGR